MGGSIREVHHPLATIGGADAQVPDGVRWSFPLRRTLDWFQVCQPAAIGSPQAVRLLIANHSTACGRVAARNGAAAMLCQCGS